MRLPALRLACGPVPALPRAHAPAARPARARRAGATAMIVRGRDWGFAVEEPSAERAPVVTLVLRSRDGTRFVCWGCTGGGRPVRECRHIAAVVGYLDRRESA